MTMPAGCRVVALTAALGLVATPAPAAEGPAGDTAILNAARAYLSLSPVRSRCRRRSIARRRRNGFARRWAGRGWRLCWHR